MARVPLTRDDILVAALPTFLRHGYRRTSMELIAEATGRSRPALYQHFRDKDDVFASLVAGLIDEVVASAERAGRANGSLPDRVFAILAVKLDAVAGDESAALRELYEQAAAQAPDLVARLSDRLRELVADALRGAATELPRLGRANSANEVAAGLVDALTGIALADATPRVRRTRLRRLTTLVIDGLAAAR